VDIIDTFRHPSTPATASAPSASTCAPSTPRPTGWRPPARPAPRPACSTARASAAGMPKRLRITEVMANQRQREHSLPGEFVELFNAGTTQVDLANMWLESGPEGARRPRSPAGLRRRDDDAGAERLRGGHRPQLRRPLLLPDGRGGGDHLRLQLRQQQPGHHARHHPLRRRRHHRAGQVPLPVRPRRRRLALAREPDRGGLGGELGRHPCKPTPAPAPCRPRAGDQLLGRHDLSEAGHEVVQAIGWRSGTGTAASCWSCARAAPTVRYQDNRWRCRASRSPTPTQTTWWSCRAGRPADFLRGELRRRRPRHGAAGRDCRPCRILAGYTNAYTSGPPPTAGVVRRADPAALLGAAAGGALASFRVNAPAFQSRPPRSSRALPRGRWAT
jgi:hypothetical protein